MQPSNAELVINGHGNPDTWQYVTYTVWRRPNEVEKLHRELPHPVYDRNKVSVQRSGGGT
jgi:hypothetical protein